MRRGQLTVVMAVMALAVAGTLAVAGYRHFGRPGPAVATAPRSSAGAPVPAGQAGPAVETNPVLAKRYAQAAVGACLAGAWRSRGYANLFHAYEGHGIVEFSTGTPAAPTGDYAGDTLIEVHVYANRSVTGMPPGSAGGPPPAALDNSALSHWGCQSGVRAGGSSRSGADVRH